jgi:hypothetical protein
MFVNCLNNDAAILTEQLEWPLDINFGGSCHWQDRFESIVGYLAGKTGLMQNAIIQKSR